MSRAVPVRLPATGNASDLVFSVAGVGQGRAGEVHPRTDEALVGVGLSLTFPEAIAKHRPSLFFSAQTCINLWQKKNEYPGHSRTGIGLLAGHDTVQRTGAGRPQGQLGDLKGREGCFGLRSRCYHSTRSLSESE
jgi:hypothetical protein